MKKMTDNKAGSKLTGHFLSATLWLLLILIVADFVISKKNLAS